VIKNKYTDTDLIKRNLSKNFLSPNITKHVEENFPLHSTNVLTLKKGDNMY
jgi:hypothetical protein